VNAATGGGMTDADRLWQGILDAPDDDDLRLVYADWLEDHGEAERGVFIRSQVELAKRDLADPRYPEVLARSRRAATFATAPAVPWRDHIPGAAVAFRRGTIDRVTIEPAEYLKHPARTWASTPLREAVFRQHREEEALVLARRPELSALRFLGLDSWRINAARALLTSRSRPARLRGLYLGSIFLSEEDDSDALAELGDALDLPDLEGLNWRHADPENWAMFVLGLRQPLRRLAVETYSDPILPDEPDDLAWLVGSRHWPTLRQLAFYHHINSISYSSIYRTPDVPDLAGRLAAPTEDLRVSLRDLSRLAEQPSWGALRTLRLGHTDLTADLAPLADAPQAAGLRQLFLDSPDGPEPENNGPRPDLLASRHLANLRRLRIDGYMLNAELVPALADGSFREGLVRLELTQYGDALSADDLADLLARPWPRLHTLRVPVRDVGALAPLLTTRHLPALTTLIVTRWSEELTEADATQLARARHLPHLSLVVEGSNEWLLASGEGRKVADDIWLLDREVYEHGPYKSA